MIAEGDRRGADARNPDSLTGRFLREPLRHPVQPRRAVIDKSVSFIEVQEGEACTT